MLLSEIMSLEDWKIVKQLAPKNPLLIAAIGWHETQWGRLGWGRSGYHLGYGCFDADNAANVYRGMEQQVRYGYAQLERDLKSFPNVFQEDIEDFGFNSWKPGYYNRSTGEYVNTGRGWGKAVWGYYTELENDYKEGKNLEKIAECLDGHWAKGFIIDCQDRGIIKGYEDGTFRPDNPITRGEVAAAISREYLHRFNLIEDYRFQTVKIQAGRALGTGIILDTCHIATNVHVVLGALGEDGDRIDMDKICITLHSGEQVQPEGIPWGNGAKDCCIIRVPELEGVCIAKLSDRIIRPGEEVFAIGFPLCFTESVSMGVISGIREIEKKIPGYGGMIKHIQTDAAINPGNSGGGLFNRYGECVGMNSWKIVTFGEGNPVDNMAFSLAADEIKQVYAVALKKEKNAGESVVDLKPGLSKYVDLVHVK